MVAFDTARLQPLERLCPALFIVGGAGVITHAALMGIEAFTAISTPPDVFVTTGHLIALVGLLGLVPSLQRKSARLAVTALVMTLVPILGWTVMTGGQLLVLAGVWESLDAALPGVIFVGLLVTSILSYGLFGAGVRYRERESRSIALLVAAPGAFMAVLLIDAMLTGASALDGLVLGGGMALSMLALGVKLRTWPARTATGRPAGVPAR